jgi:hypothetical protein
MKHVLLATATLLVAAALPTAPAQAQSSAGATFVGVSTPSNGGVRIHRGFGGDRDRRRHRDGRFSDDQLGIWVDGGEWALYNNRSWLPDSYNDWWHDRPDRAYPRWMLSNQNCERKWWSGSGWKC